VAVDIIIDFALSR